MAEELTQNVNGICQEYPFRLTVKDVISDNNSILNINVFTILMKLYMSGLIFEYILVFVLVPFDKIDNRPHSCVVSIFFCLGIFCIDSCMYPLILPSVPNQISMRLLVISLFFQVSNLIMCFIATWNCLRTTNMFMNQYSEALKQTIKVDATFYFHITSIIMLIVSFLTTALLSIAGILEFRALSDLVNMIDPKFVKDPNARIVTISDSLPDHLIAEQSQMYRV